MRAVAKRVQQRWPFQPRDDLYEAEAVHRGAFMRPVRKRRRKCFVHRLAIGLGFRVGKSIPIDPPRSNSGSQRAISGTCGHRVAVRAEAGRHRYRSASSPALRQTAALRRERHFAPEAASRCPPTHRRATAGRVPSARRGWVAAGVVSSPSRLRALEVEHVRNRLRVSRPGQARRLRAHRAGCGRPAVRVRREHCPSARSGLARPAWKQRRESRRGRREMPGQRSRRGSRRRRSAARVVPMPCSTRTRVTQAMSNPAV